MNLAILQKDVQQFIADNLKTDITKLILKGSPFSNITVQELANQIIAKEKSRLKLPTWSHTKQIYYPPKLSIEQTSSEVTANYKSKIISGESIIDITGGFGVDCFYFSKQFKEVVHCEINEELSKTVAYNFNQLNTKNITTFTGNGLEYLKKTNKVFDCIYIDPSRRNDKKGKVFLLKDCLPNVPQNIDFLFSKSKTILIKNSPLLDISSTINELKFVKEIHIIALNNDVKELLFLLDKNFEGEIKIITRNIHKENIQEFEFNFNKAVFSNFSEPLNFLYEPNSAILKSGGFDHVSNQLDVYKLHQNSHLYTSQKQIYFPGRAFKIEHVIAYDKKKLAKLIPEKKANITIRNFPKTVAQIRKETKLKEGGKVYIFFTKDLKNKSKLVICKKIKTKISNP